MARQGADHGAGRELELARQLPSSRSLRKAGRVAAVQQEELSLPSAGLPVSPAPWGTLDVEVGKTPPTELPPSSHQVSARPWELRKAAGGRVPQGSSCGVGCTRALMS